MQMRSTHKTEKKKTNDASCVVLPIQQIEKVKCMCNIVGILMLSVRCMLKQIVMYAVNGMFAEIDSVC